MDMVVDFCADFWCNNLSEIRVDVTVWKNAEGKFNAARFASDATAGVVLGTVGGLVSNKLVKKNQIKKGFESINCSVGGMLWQNMPMNLP